MSRKLAKSIVLPTTLFISLSAWAALSSSNPPGVNFPVIPENYKLTTFDSSGAQVDIDPLSATYYDNYFTLFATTPPIAIPVFRPVP